MKPLLLYVELKTGHSDDGPAWIGFGECSKSGRTIYFNDRAFQSCKGRGVSANYFDLESGDEYWISGVKKDRTDRHWAGRGKVMIDRTSLRAYLDIIGRSELPDSYFEIVDLEQGNVKSRIHAQQNRAEVTDH